MKRLATRRGVALAGWVLAAIACDGAPEADRAGPPSLRAALVLEPPVLGVGEVGVLELVVVTPPGHGVRPAPTPAPTEGLRLVGREDLEAERRGERWLHRTRLRVQARAVGSHRWPAGRALVETPDGAVASVEYDALPVEVASVLPEHPERLAPFGVRAPDAPPEWIGSLGSAVAGAAFALTAVGLVALARRRARARAAGEPTAPPPEPPWVSAREALDTAERRLADDPLGAADAIAHALRRYVSRRFGADAEACTTPELARARPPFTATSRWPRFLELLEALDAERFPPRDRPAEARVAELLADVRRFVDESVPDTARPRS